MSRSRIRCRSRKSSCSLDSTATKRIVGRVTASAIASASLKSFFYDLRYALTNFGAMSRTSCPYRWSERARCCDPGQVSAPTKQGGRLAMNWAAQKNGGITLEVVYAWKLKMWGISSDVKRGIAIGFQRTPARRTVIAEVPMHSPPSNRCRQISCRPCENRARGDRVVLEDEAGRVRGAVLDGLPKDRVLTEAAPLCAHDNPPQRMDTCSSSADVGLTRG